MRFKGSLKQNKGSFEERINNTWFGTLLTCEVLVFTNKLFVCSVITAITKSPIVYERILIYSHRHKTFHNRYQLFPFTLSTVIYNYKVFWDDTRCFFYRRILNKRS